MLNFFSKTSERIVLNVSLAHGTFTCEMLQNQAAVVLIVSVVLNTSRWQHSAPYHSLYFELICQA